MKHKRLIILYGKPGVGKLTVAKEIHLLTKFPILHSHLTSDLVYSVFSRNHPEGSLLKQRIRVEVLDAWGKYGGTSIIATQLYKKDNNEKYFIEMADTIKQYEFDVFYIHLRCSENENRRRVESSERKMYGKITDWDDALEKMKKNSMDENVPFENNFEIDTTDFTIEDTAKKVLELIQKQVSG